MKPDVGCNGNGVRLVESPAALEAAVASFPPGVCLLLQRYVPDPAEAGLFYIRHPNEAVGRLTSVTLKQQPTVVGDGRSTLEALIRADPRAGMVAHLYLIRLASRLTEIPPAGEVVPLVFTGNHCKGAIFLNGADRITPALTRQVDEIARDIPGFYFGRIDVRYGSEAALRLGRDFTIIELNGAGVRSDAYLGCALHPSRGLRCAIRALSGCLGDWAGKSGEGLPSERAAHHVSGVAAPNAVDGVLPNQRLRQHDQDGFVPACDPG